MNRIIDSKRKDMHMHQTSPAPLVDEIENTRRLIAEFNTGYRTPDEIRSYLEQIWRQPLDDSVRIFPPFYTAFGKRTTVGKEVFINFGCTFLD